MFIIKIIIEIIILESFKVVVIKYINNKYSKMAKHVWSTVQCSPSNSMSKMNRRKMILLFSILVMIFNFSFSSTCSSSVSNLDTITTQTMSIPSASYSNLIGIASSPSSDNLYYLFLAQLSGSNYAAISK